VRIEPSKIASTQVSPGPGVINRVQEQRRRAASIRFRIAICWVSPPPTAPSRQAPTALAAGGGCAPGPRR
jgi:hypothetical protein